MERRREKPRAEAKARERKHAADGTAGGSDVGQPRHEAKKARIDDDEAGGSRCPHFAPSQTQAQALWDEGLRHEQDGRPEAALAALTKVLISCVCQKETRRQFRAAGVPLGSIDPVGRCSCKDFVAAAQTRRQRQQQCQQQQQQQQKGPLGSSSAVFPISELDLDAVYRLATSRGCGCGSGRVRCEQPSHVAVVDRMAALASRLQRHDEALRLAQSMVDLAPQQAESYLRLAKAVLGGRTATATAASMRFAARCIYAHGVHNVGRHGRPDTTPAQLLGYCVARYGRGDYLPQLPVELVEAVLQHLALADVLRCCRVSRAWAAMLRRVRVRPAVVSLGARFMRSSSSSSSSSSRGGRGRQSGPASSAPPGLAALARLLRRLPHLDAVALELNVDGPSARLPHLPAPRESALPFVALALHHFSGVESLSVHLPDSCPRSLADVLRQEDLLPPSQRARVRLLSRCRSLDVHNPGPGNAQALLGLLADAGPTLQSLALTDPSYAGRTIGSAGFVDLRLPRLACFQTRGTCWCTKADRAILPAICMAAPGLEQVLFEDVRIELGTYEDALPGYDRATVLGSLHTLVMVRGTGAWLDDDAPDVRSFPMLPTATMRCVDLRADGGPQALVHAVLEALQLDGPEGGALPRLEAFRSDSLLPEPMLERLLERTSGGVLASLELSGYDLEHGLLHDARLAVARPERLRNVGLSEINWDRDPGLPGYVAGRSVITWLARFPHLETVTLHHHDAHQGDDLLLALVDTIKRAREEATRAAGDAGETGARNTWASLGTIYDGSVLSVTRDRAVRLAQSLGISVLPRERNARGLVFPWPAQPGL